MCPECGDATYISDCEGRRFLLCVNPNRSACCFQRYIGKTPWWGRKYNKEKYDYDLGWLIAPESIGVI
jgi:hypothetical protein